MRDGANDNTRTGIIGPGLLVGSGAAFHEGGPAGSLISFSLIGIIVFFVMWVQMNTTLLEGC